MSVEHAVGFACDGGIDDVRNGNGARAFGLGFALCRRGVGGLAGLRDDDGEFARADQRIAIFKLAGVVHIHRNVDQVLNHVLPGHARVTAGARGHDVDAAQRAKFVRADADIVEPHHRFLERYAGLNRVAQALRLLEDFLQHVVGKSAFVSHSILLRSTRHVEPPGCRRYFRSSV